jgi:hypothetical protein
VPRDLDAREFAWLSLSNYISNRDGDGNHRKFHDCTRSERDSAFAVENYDT